MILTPDYASISFEGNFENSLHGENHIVPLNLIVAIMIHAVMTY